MVNTKIQYTCLQIMRCLMKFTHDYVDNMDVLGQNPYIATKLLSTPVSRRVVSITLKRISITLKRKCWNEWILKILINLSSLQNGRHIELAIRVILTQANQRTRYHISKSSYLLRTKIELHIIMWNIVSLWTFILTHMSS